MVRVRLKTLETEAIGFLCSLASSVVGRSLKDCEAKLGSEGYIELELDPATYEALEERVKKYSFIQMEVLTRIEDNISVRVRLKGHTSPSLACNILSGLLGYRVEGCVEALSAKGELTLDLNPELAAKLVSSAKAYPFLEVQHGGNLHLQNTYRSVSEEGGAFERSWRFLKNNIGFFAVYGVVLVLLFLLSIIPLIGLVFNILLGLVAYAVILYVSVSYIGGQREGLQFSRIFSYMAPSAGLYFGGIVLMILAALFSVFLLIVFGGLGAIHDAIYEGEMGVGLITSLGVYLILLLLVAMYYLYTIPLIYSRVLLRGMDFVQGFLAVFYPFIPSGFKEAFSNAYLKNAGLWLVAVSIVFPLAIIAMITIILIPVGIVLVLWLAAYTATVICDYASERYKMGL